jgi:hypothetical protein
MIGARSSTFRCERPALFRGGLLAYGLPVSRFARQWVQQLIKVLRGANPAELPIEQPTDHLRPSSQSQDPPRRSASTSLRR